MKVRVKTNYGIPKHRRARLDFSPTTVELEVDQLTLALLETDHALSVEWLEGKADHLAAWRAPGVPLHDDDYLRDQARATGFADWRTASRSYLIAGIREARR